MSRLNYIWQIAPDDVLRTIAWTLLVTSVGFALVLYWRAARAVAATCPQCEYDLRGLTIDTCPECGSSLRRTGIVNAGCRNTRTILCIAFWTLWLLCVATITYPIVARHVNPGRLLTTQTFQLPQSKAYGGIIVSARSSTGLWGVERPRKLMVMIRMHDHQTYPGSVQMKRGQSMLVDRQRGSAQLLDFEDQPVGSEWPFDESTAHSAVKAWLQANGIAGNEVALNGEASELAASLLDPKFVQHASGGKTFESGATLRTSAPMRKRSGAFGDVASIVDFQPIESKWVNGQVLMTWIFIWIFGVLVILALDRRGRRRMRLDAARYFESQGIPRAA